MKNNLEKLLQYPFISFTIKSAKGEKVMAKKLIKSLVRHGFKYVDTIYDDFFIYDVFQKGHIKKIVCIGTL